MSAHSMAGGWPARRAWMMSAGKGHRRFVSEDDMERMAALRHFRGGPPFGPWQMFGPPFGGGRGRKRRGDVRIALLLLIAEEPRNGYQLMQAIETRSGGRWRPSPGSVYPALAQLEDEGLIRVAEREGSKLFEITETGRAALGERGEATAPWEFDEDPAFEAAADLRSLVAQIGIAAMQVGQAGTQEQVARASETLAETRRTLYRILADDAEPPAADSSETADV
jgi:DNA-binding PadR family transcriptional regulator